MPDGLTGLSVLSDVPFGHHDPCRPAIHDRMAARLDREFGRMPCAFSPDGVSVSAPCPQDWATPCRFRGSV